MSGLLGFVLPDTLQFLHWGWLGVHLIAIASVFTLGRSVGKRSKTPQPPAK